MWKKCWVWFLRVSRWCSLWPSSILLCPFLFRVPLWSYSFKNLALRCLAFFCDRYHMGHISCIVGIVIIRSRFGSSFMRSIPHFGESISVWIRRLGWATLEEIYWMTDVVNATFFPHGRQIPVGDLGQFHAGEFLKDQVPNMHSPGTQHALTRYPTCIDQVPNMHCPGTQHALTLFPTFVSHGRQIPMGYFTWAPNPRGIFHLGSFFTWAPNPRG